MSYLSCSKFIAVVFIAVIGITNASTSGLKQNSNNRDELSSLLRHDSYTERTPFEWALVRLDYARKEKVDKLNSFCQRIHNLAIKARNDKFVNACFDINLQYESARKDNPSPQQLDDKINQLRNEFNSYYIQEYYAFYDILFINTDGHIFYTLRKESELNENLNGKPFSDTPLGHCIKKAPTQEVFVDFHNYGPSQEPASFFVEPIYKNNQLTGWVVLQCAANKLDSLFAWTHDLGSTGETFLVNQKGFMLTESNFQGESTILKKRLDDRNIQAKFNDGSGHRLVTDYRSQKALSSFEVVSFLNTKWLVVAKMDKDEIITQHYIQHRKYFGDTLIRNLENKPKLTPRDIKHQRNKNTIRIDMDEFIKANNAEQLETFGISTCTGMLISYPGKFAYMAHISPKDRLYGSTQTNLLEQMLKKVTTFDIYPCERRKLTFMIIANHLESTLAIVDELLEKGFMLSQIRIMYNPEAQSAKVNYDYSKNDLLVSWHMINNKRHSNILNDAFDIGSIIENSMQNIAKQ